jgi:hypothetical protein
MNSVDYNGSFGPFFKTVMWSYLGTKDSLTDPKFQSFSVINYVQIFRTRLSSLVMQIHLPINL